MRGHSVARGGIGCAVRTGWTWCPRPFLGVRNRASGCQAVRAVLASFGTRGSQVQILSPRPTIPAELQTKLSQRIRLPRDTADFGPQVDHDLIAGRVSAGGAPDRKSTRLNSSHDQISYAVFCLKKKTISFEM